MTASDANISTIITRFRLDAIAIITSAKSTSPLRQTKIPFPETAIDVRIFGPKTGSPLDRLLTKLRPEAWMRTHYSLNTCSFVNTFLTETLLCSLLTIAGFFTRTLKYIVPTRLHLTWGWGWIESHNTQFTAPVSSSMPQYLIHAECRSNCWKHR